MPYADGVDVTIEQDPATAFANFIVNGGYDLAPEYGFVVRRIDLDLAKQKVQGLQTRDYTVMFGGITAMKLDQDPFKDVRVRRALATARRTGRKCSRPTRGRKARALRTPAFPPR